VTIGFGDDTTGTMEQAPTCFGCSTLSVAGHIYQSPGTYIARLVSAGGPLGSQVITVTLDSKLLYTGRSPTRGVHYLAATAAYWGS
jgi:hypothetical protein